MARYTQDPPRRPNDPPNKTLGELQEISHQPKSKWPKLSAPDQYVVERMIREGQVPTAELGREAAGLRLRLQRSGQRTSDTRARSESVV